MIVTIIVIYVNKLMTYGFPDLFSSSSSLPVARGLGGVVETSLEVLSEVLDWASLVVAVGDCVVVVDDLVGELFSKTSRIHCFMSLLSVYDPASPAGVRLRT